MVIIQIYSKFIFSFCLIFGILATGCTTPAGTGTVSTALIQKAYSPTWAPDGQQFAFLYRARNENSQEVRDFIYTALLDGSDVTKLREVSPARFKSVHWSPTGQEFILASEITEEIYAADSNGDNFRKLVDGDNPSWSPEGNKFVCTYDNQCETSDRVGGLQCQRQIRLYDIPSKTFIALPIALEREVIGPAWSADGLSIQWLSTTIPQTKELSEQRLEIHKFNIASQSHQVTEITKPLNVNISNVNWSPDRNLMAFSYLSRIHLYFFSVADTFSITEGVDPSFSIDNTRLLYTNLIGENHSDIAIFDRRDNTVRTIIAHTGLPLEE